MDYLGYLFDNVFWCVAWYIDFICFNFGFSTMKTWWLYLVPAIGLTGFMIFGDEFHWLFVVYIVLCLMVAFVDYKKEQIIFNHKDYEDGT